MYEPGFRDEVNRNISNHTCTLQRFCNINFILTVIEPNRREMSPISQMSEQATYNIRFRFSNNLPNRKGLEPPSKGFRKKTQAQTEKNFPSFRTDGQNGHVSFKTCMFLLKASEAERVEMLFLDITRNLKWKFRNFYGFI